MSNQELRFDFELLTTRRSQLFSIKYDVERAGRELEEATRRYATLKMQEEILRREVARLDGRVNH